MENHFSILLANERGEIATEKLLLPPRNFIYVLKNKLFLWKCNTHIMQNAKASTSFPTERYKAVRFCININHLKCYNPPCFAALFLWERICDEFPKLNLARSTNAGQHQAQGTLCRQLHDFTEKRAKFVPFVPCCSISNKTRLN